MDGVQSKGEEDINIVEKSGEGIIAFIKRRLTLNGGVKGLLKNMGSRRPLKKGREGKIFYNRRGNKKMWSGEEGKEKGGNRSDVSSW